MVLEIQANSGQAASALEEVEAKVSQLKQGFRDTSNAASSKLNQIGQQANQAEQKVHSLADAAVVLSGEAKNAFADAPLSGSFQEIQNAAEQAQNSVAEFSGQITGSLQKAINQAAEDFQKFGDIALQSFSRLEAASEDLQRRQQLIGDSAEELGQKIQNAYIDGIESVQGFNRAQQNVFDELVDRTGQGVRSVDSMEAAFADLQKRADLVGGDLQQAFEKGEASIRQTGRAVDDFSGKAATMRSSVSATSNNLAFELTQASQDAAFGLQGVANQIPLISRQFSDLTKKTGSTSAAISSLASTFLGPVGIISGITLAASFLPDLISLFSDASDEAEETTESFEGLLHATQDLQQQLLPTGKQFENVTEPLQELDGAVTGVEALVQSLEGGLLAGAGTQAPGQAFSARAEAVRRFAQRLNQSGQEGELLRNALESAGVQVEDIRQAAEVSQDALTESARAGEGAFTQAKQAILGAQEALIAFSEDPVQAIDDPQLAANQLRDELERISARIEEQRALPGLIEDDTEAAQQRLRALESAAERVIRASELDIDAEEFDFLRKRLKQAGVRLEELKKDTSDAADETERMATAAGVVSDKFRDTREVIQQILSGAGVGEIASAIETGLIQSSDDAESALQSLKTALGQATSQEERQRIKRLIDEVERLEAAIEGTKQELAPGSFLAPPGTGTREVPNQPPTREVLGGQGTLGLEQQAEEETEEGTKEGIITGAEVGSAAFQGIMSTAIGEITREIENNFARAITSAVLQALSSAAVEKLANLLEGDSEDSGDTVDKSLSLANSLVNAFSDQKKGGSGGGFGGISSLLGSGKSGLSLPKGAGAAAGAFSIGQVLGRTIRPSKNKGAGLAGLGGAGIGAVLGSVIPGLGTLIGAGIGGGLGGLLGGIFQDGGPVSGPGGPRSDIIPALLSDKEFVMNAQTAQAAPALMKALNEDPSVARSLQNSFGRPQALSAGGHVGSAVGTNGSMPSGASGVTVNIDTEVRRLRGRELGLVIRENEQRKAQFS